MHYLASINLMLLFYKNMGLLLIELLFRIMLRVIDILVPMLMYNDLRIFFMYYWKVFKYDRQCWKYKFCLRLMNFRFNEIKKKRILLLSKSKKLRNSSNRKNQLMIPSNSKKNSRSQNKRKKKTIKNKDKRHLK